MKTPMQKALELLKLRNAKAKAPAPPTPAKKGPLVLKAILFIPAVKKQPTKKLELPKPKNKIVDGVALESAKVNITDIKIRKNYSII